MNRTLCTSVLLSRALCIYISKVPRPHSTCSVGRGIPVVSLSLSRFHSTNVKVRSYLQYMKRKIKPPPNPPYPNVCQVGDPVLRAKAALVDPGSVLGPEVQEVIRTMVKVMRKFDCVGLSAPQVGVPLRILALEFPERMLEDCLPAAREARGLITVPLKIFINPQLRVLDGRTVKFQEACESLSGSQPLFHATSLWKSQVRESTCYTEQLNGCLNPHVDLIFPQLLQPHLSLEQWLVNIKH
uniref:Peptide deformylase n=1 Tax=Esox lucius TaxID=8010 RepID=A0AAY5JZJ3_ESOLU